MEPTSTAVVLTIVGLLLLSSVVAVRLTGRSGIPAVLVFLVLGMLAGEDGIGGLAFDDYGLAFRAGTVALTFILFDGGLNLSLPAARRALAPAVALATVGVVATAAIVAWCAWWLGLDPVRAMLIGAVVSSTDAAAVFATLRSTGLRLSERVSAILEVESGTNDPMAVILTTLLTGAAFAHAGPLTGWHVALDAGTQIAIGLAAGVAFGFGAARLMARMRLPAGGLYPVLSVAIALLAFGLPTLAHGSGFLAVYIAGVIIGNAEFPYRSGLLRVHDALAWLSQVAMFLLLGLLVHPPRLLGVAPVGFALALVLAFVARPVVVAACLAPFRLPFREIAYIAWTGLRGAVPIVLATYPVLVAGREALTVFDVVFFIVVVNAILPGSTLVAFTRWIGFSSEAPPQPRAVLEVTSLEPLHGRLLSFHVSPALAVAGAQLSDLPFPEGTSVTLIVRGRELVAPKGTTVIEPDDHVYVVCRAEHEDLVRLLFGRPEE
ncbi:MAG TPA: potassium/proton antiporter [Candidatus Binatia bacterium]|nr:potassium/proton antiporter [Candidatus Binatia bacterium]